MSWEPTGSADVVTLAVPVADRVAVPRSRPVSVSTNLTDPVGTREVPSARTVAVKVTACPKYDGGSMFQWVNVQVSYVSARPPPYTHFPYTTRFRSSPR